MLIALIALQLVTLAVAVLLFLRKTTGAPGNDSAARLETQVSDLAARLGRLDEALTQIRREAPEEAARTRRESAEAAAELRREVVGSVTLLGGTLKDGLDGLRSDNLSAAATLRAEVEQRLASVARGFADLKEETAARHSALRESMSERLGELMTSNSTLQEKLRAVVEDRLTKLNESNSAKLEEMRLTVDEKLHATLQSRLTESFGQVTTHLGEVQKGLGEMKQLATGVGDLKKVLSNVKARGVVGEFQLGQQLEQMFSPEQYIKNARIKKGTLETVEYALKFPNGEPGSYVLLAIDAKFPKDDWERLENAYEHGGADEIAAAGRAFERAIRTEGKRICEKYIDPPTTMPHAIMFLPTEGLYAEVVRRPGLLAEVQSNCHVTIAGPATFMAILTSFQMGFHTLAIQKKGDEVWKVLSRAKTEFATFGTLMDKVERQVGTVQNTLREINGKTTTINRALKNVASLDTGAPAGRLLDFEEMADVVPALAAARED